MKKLSVIILLFISLSIEFYAQEQNKTEFRKVINNAFKDGEELSYTIRYGFIKAGKAVISVENGNKVAGRDVHHINLLVRSLPSFDWIYWVKTTYESYIDREGLFPWRFEQHIRESNFSNDFSAFFDQRNNRAITSEGIYEMEKYSQDVVSAFYYARTFDYSNLKKGDRFSLVNFYNDKVHNLDIIYHGKEKISTSLGDFNCLIVEPLVVEGGFFKSEGNIILYMSDDELKIPVMVKIKVIIGALTVELIEYKGLAGELKSKISD